MRSHARDVRERTKVYRTDLIEHGHIELEGHNHSGHHHQSLAAFCRQRFWTITWLITMAIADPCSLLSVMEQSYM